MSIFFKMGIIRSLWMTYALEDLQAKQDSDANIWNCITSRHEKKLYDLAPFSLQSECCWWDNTPQQLYTWFMLGCALLWISTSRFYSYPSELLNLLTDHVPMKLPCRIWVNKSHESKCSHGTAKQNHTMRTFMEMPCQSTAKGSYLPCVSMAGRALLAGYHR